MVIIKMELTPVKFLVMFLLAAVLGYIVYILLARLGARALRRRIGGVVNLRIAGINAFKEICIEFHQGPIASVTISEFKVCFRRPPSATGWNIFSWRSKLQIVVSDIEVVVRKLTQERSTKSHKRKAHKHNPAGRGIWMVFTNVAKYFSISLNEISVKLLEPAKLTLEIKEVNLDIFRDDALGLKLFLAPCIVYAGGDDERTFEGPGIFRFRENILPPKIEDFIIFSLEHFTVTGTIDHEREAGLVAKQIAAACGVTLLNITSDLILQLTVQDSAPAVPESTSKIASLNEKQPELGARISTTWVPDAMEFSMPKIELNFYFEKELSTSQRGYSTIKNEVKSLSLRGNKSRPPEGSLGVISLLEVQMDFGEIHVCRGEHNSVIDIMKVSVSGSAEFPTELTRPLRTEIDVKLGGTQLNLLMNRYADLLNILSLRRMFFTKKSSPKPKSSGRQLTISWSCSISAPEMAVFLHNLNGLPLMHLSSQTSHLYINIVPGRDTVIHAELDEVYLNKMEEGTELPIEFLAGVESCTGVVVHVSRVSFDRGVDADRIDTENTGESTLEVGPTEVYAGLSNIKAAIVTYLAIKACKKLFTSKKNDLKKDKERKRFMMKLHFDQLLIQFDEEINIENAVVPDPKKVNFGSQGGEVVITKQEEGPRTARVCPSDYEAEGYSGIKQKLALTVLNMVITFDRDKQADVEKCQMLYEEIRADKQVISKRILASVCNIKLIHRKTNEVLKYILVRANDVNFHWDPDAHLLFYEIFLRTKELFHRHSNANTSRSSNVTARTPQKIAYALDIENMTISGELADGVEGTVNIQSIFTEDAVVGLVFENMEVALNKAVIATSESLQISRLPSLMDHHLWDIIVRGRGLHIIMPYRLPLRAIDDAVEDTWRALKLSMAAKRSWISPGSIPSVKPKGNSARIFSFKFYIQGIVAEIEEEPLQGWFDEHYRLLRHHCRVLFVREKLLEESKGTIQQTKPKIWEKLQEQSFQEYKQACINLVPGRVSGACNSGFQAGFKPSIRRTSLMSISAENLDLTLTQINGGRTGMIEFIRRVDCAKEMDIPFSRLYGGHIVISMTSVVVCLRDYTSPLLSASTAKCEGNVVFAQQATVFQKQVIQQLYVGRWRKVDMLRSMSGLTPSYKFYSELPIEMENAKVSYSVGFEPAFADVTYAFTVALRRDNLSVRKDRIYQPPPVRKEKSLPWWDDMRYYIHGVNSIDVSGFEWNFLSTTDPYENDNKMQMISSKMLIRQTEGKISFLGSNFDMYISSLESVISSERQFIHAPVFELDITMDWSCASGEPLNHYLHAFPNELQPRAQVYDPFRSTSLSLVWSFSLRTENSEIEAHKNYSGKYKKAQKSHEYSTRISDTPFMSLCAQDLMWIFKWWNLYFNPPHKLRSFSRWPRYGVERVPRSGNLSLDKVMTEFILRLDSTPTTIKHFSTTSDDPAEGLTFNMHRLRYELCYSRGLEKYTFESKRDILDLVYQGLDVHLLKTKLVSPQHDTSLKPSGVRCEKLDEDGFLLSTDCFTIRKQSPKADPTRLSSWREHVQVHRGDDDKTSDAENSGSDPSDDDGFNVVLADNCLRVSLYGLKLFWNIPNRDAVWAWAGHISKAFEAPKPSPSRQYAQLKLMEEKQSSTVAESDIKPANSGSSNDSLVAEEPGTLQFMVNVVQPQFNLHSEDAHGRFLLAAASGKVLARSFLSIFSVGIEGFEKALGSAAGQLPLLSWKRRELSVILEHVQAHVAPTDVDPGAGIQWLPRIPKGAVEVKRTGALLERVFLPCTMYFQYIRHKGGTTDCKVKPLKELSFNSPNITATMTSRQFHIMVDVLSNLLFATLPKPRKREEEEDIEEATDEVVPDGVEEVELAKIKLEQAERDLKLISDDLKIIHQQSCTTASDSVASPDRTSSGDSSEGSLNRALTRQSSLVRALEVDLASKKRARKQAHSLVRLTLQRAAHQRLSEKEKNKSPSAAMRISWAIEAVVWSMLSDGGTFAEAIIKSMILNVDRDFKDIGVARFTVKTFEVKNGLKGLKQAKSDTVLSAWNPPDEWGRNVMLRVHAKQGAPKEGHSLLELFQVEIYPLKIFLTEAMYKMMWDYFFPADEQDPRQRQEVWKGTTNSGSKRSKRGGEFLIKEAPARASAPGTPPRLHGLQIPQRGIDFALAAQTLSHVSKTRNIIHQRTSSLDRTLRVEETEKAEYSEMVVYADAASLARSSTVPSSDDMLATISASTAIEVSETVTKTKKSRAGKAAQDYKKVSKYRKLEIDTIKISQVELLVTYAGSKFSISDLRLLMDTYAKTEFTGSWRRLFSSVKKHIIWGVLKSLTGIQGKKFKDKMQAAGNGPFEDSDSNSSDSSTSKTRIREKLSFPIPLLQKHAGAGEGFVSSIRGLFNSQRRKTRALVRTMRGEGAGEHHHHQNERSDGDGRTLRSKSKQLLRRHSLRKQRSNISKGAILLGDRYCSSPRASPYHSDAESSGSSTYEDFDT